MGKTSNFTFLPKLAFSLIKWKLVRSLPCTFSTLHCGCIILVPIWLWIFAKKFEMNQNSSFSKVCKKFNLTFVFIIFLFSWTSGKNLLLVWILRGKEEREIKISWNWAKRIKKVKVFLLKVSLPWISIVLQVRVLILFLLSLSFASS